MKKIFIALFVLSCMMLASCGSSVVCPLCKGYAKITTGRDSMQCPVCEGSKTISAKAFEKITKIDTCSVCKGAGSVAGVKCPVCAGSCRGSKLQLYQWLCKPYNSKSELKDSL